MKSEKVEIIIKEGRYDKSVKNGCKYIDVSCNGRSYGSGSPCDNEEEMKRASDKLLTCTDDGSYGKKGFVTQVLQEIMDAEKIDFVLGIGPLPMMRAVANTTRESKIKTMVSLNPIMIDGTGMCGGRRVTVGGKIKFVCVDGPEFDGHLVNFDEIGKRLISEDRIVFYKEVLSSVSKKTYRAETKLNSEVVQFFGIFGKLFHSLPSDYFSIDLEKNMIERID